jgi:hypothetical protein
MTEMSDSAEVMRTTLPPTGLELTATIGGPSNVPGRATASGRAVR